MTDRDPVVARALQDVPVPDHLPGFWEALDARLDELDAAAADLGADAGRVATTPPPVRGADRPAAPPGGGRVDTSELPAVAALRPPAPPPARHRLRFLAAAAAVAVVALAAGLLVRDSGPTDEGGELAGTPEATAAPTTPAPDGSRAETFAADPTEQPAGSTATGMAMDSAGAAVAGAATAVDAVATFTDALGAGDLASARALLGPRTAARLAALGRDGEGLLVAMAEGWGSWSGSPDRRLAEVPIPGAGSVVVLEGTRAPEGRRERATHALPVVPAAGGWLVEPMALGSRAEGPVELRSPAPAPDGWSPLSPGGAFVAVAPGADAYWFSVDGGPPIRSADGRFDPPGDLAPGEHLVVVAAVGDGVFTATAARFAVSG